MVNHTIGKAELSSASLLDLCPHDNCSPSHAFSWSHTFFLEGCKDVDESRPQYLRHLLVFQYLKMKWFFMCPKCWTTLHLCGWTTIINEWKTFFEETEESVKHLSKQSLGLEAGLFNFDGRCHWTKQTFRLVKHTLQCVYRGSPRMVG